MYAILCRIVFLVTQVWWLVTNVKDCYTFIVVTTYFILQSFNEGPLKVCHFIQATEMCRRPKGFVESYIIHSTVYHIFYKRYLCTEIACWSKLGHHFLWIFGFYQRFESLYWGVVKRMPSGSMSQVVLAVYFQHLLIIIIHSFLY